MWVLSLGWEYPQEEKMTTHSIVKLFSSEKFHGQRNLVGYSPWGHSGWTPLSTHSTADCMPVNYSETNRPSNLIFIRICMVIVLCMCVLSHVQRLTLCDSIALQAPLSMQFSRQEYWSGLPFPTPGDLSNLGIEPMSLVHLLHWQTDSLPLCPLGSINPT